jgi:hypothetical protein
MSMSLIQQRIAIDRTRVLGIVITAIGGGVLIIGALVLTSSLVSPGTITAIVVWVAFMGRGITFLVKARRLRLEFEESNGSDAGKQAPIR